MTLADRATWYLPNIYAVPFGADDLRIISGGIDQTRLMDCILNFSDPISRSKVGMPAFNRDAPHIISCGYLLMWNYRIGIDDAVYLIHGGFYCKQDWDQFEAVMEAFRRCVDLDYIEARLIASTMTAAEECGTFTLTT